MSAVYSVYSTIGSWLKAGWNFAVSAVKWIWEKAYSMFSKAWDKVRDIYRRLNCSSSNNGETLNVPTGSERVEVNTDVMRYYNVCGISL